MGALNLYKINKEKKKDLIQELKNNLTKSQAKRLTDPKDPDIEFTMTLFYSSPENERNINWNWILKEYNEPTLFVSSYPKAVLLIEENNNFTYAVTYGYSYFIVNKYADKNFGFDFARKIEFAEIKTTTLVTPNYRRNKTINTYINYDELEFDSGESFAKIKAKAKLSDDFKLFKPSLEIGTSIRCVTEYDSLCNIILIIRYIENKIINGKTIYKIPVFSTIKDNELIEELNNRTMKNILENSTLSISEFDIIGTIEVFNRNDDEFILKYKNKTKHINSLSYNELKSFCQENEFDFEKIALDIKVQIIREGTNLREERVGDIIDFTDDNKRCILSKGVWYRYNDDYLEYLKESIDEIKTEYHHEYDFTKDIYNDFINTLLPDAKKDSENKDKSEKEIILKLKKKYYAERAFNIIMERKYGFENIDRDNKNIGGATVEIADLYKDKTIYSVKIGNTSSKLCYAVEQSISTLHLYKHKKVSNLPEIDTIAIWLILERDKHIEENGKPNINSLNMLMLKNKLDQWKKEVRLQGYTPLIMINYRIM